MSELIVVAFANDTKAEKLLGKVGELQKQHLIELDDAATVIRKEDGKVKVKQANNLVGSSGAAD